MNPLMADAQPVNAFTGLRYDLRKLLPWCLALTVGAILGQFCYGLFLWRFLSITKQLETGALARPDFEIALAKLDAYSNAIAIGCTSVILLAFILNGVWIYRASSNASQIVPHFDRIRPGWAVGWYFVPIANLWKPFSAMRQIWVSSHDPQRGFDGTSPEFFTLWWAGWLTWTIGGRISQRMAREEASHESLMYSIWLDLFLVLVWFGTALLFMKIMRNVTKAQAGRSPAIQPSANPDARADGGYQHG